MSTTSAYPDGSTRPQVALDRSRAHSLLPDGKVRCIVCHRINNAKKQEEYLVEWRGQSTYPQYSWHVVSELSSSLRKVQRYLEALYKERQEYATKQNANANLVLPIIGLKRKSPDQSASLSPPSSPASSVSSKSSGLGLYAPYYNGTVTRQDGIISIKPWPEDQCYRDPLPTPAMEAYALDKRHQTAKAEFAIRKEFKQKLLAVPGPLLTLDSSAYGAPPLAFDFVSESVLREGVTRADPETVVGCGITKHGHQICRPHMGQNIGCEYSRVCDCLEYAPVDEKRLTAEQREQREDGETMGIPKRFPYATATAARPHHLIDFYLDKRDTIYECNIRCQCGPNCKTRVVQKGRQIPLEIFKTEKRGWGLRSPVDIQRGQFVDTYRGEIITLEEAKRRQEQSKGKGKGSYLYDLDKNVLDEDGNYTTLDFFVVDGEHMGGPTRFINHSCDPNCGQYVVSLNKYDNRIYELAFFAQRDIPAGTELTFDYLDKDDEAAEEEEGVKDGDSIRCFCGAPNCRKWLWK